MKTLLPNGVVTFSSSNPFADSDNGVVAVPAPTVVAGIGPTEAAIRHDHQQLEEPAAMAESLFEPLFFGRAS